MQTKNRPNSSGKGKPGGKRFQKRRPGGGGGGGPRPKSPRSQKPADIENTGYEANYFKELVDHEIPIVVVLRTGEELQGQVRYYDRDVFSLGQENGPKLFLRKSSVRYLYEIEV